MWRCELNTITAHLMNTLQKEYSHSKMYHEVIIKFQPNSNKTAGQKMGFKRYF